MLVSYAQNFEDVMLWRALGHVTKGRYLDVGAQDPNIDSISKAFHELGWSGWHVEPTGYAQALRDQRHGDVVLAAAVGTAQGLETFYEFPGTGLSTPRGDIARSHEAQSVDFKAIERKVPTIPLSKLLDECAGGQDLHWLKIDVEGSEADVLESWDDSPVRPWIVVVESTKPLSEEESHAEWEHQLLSRNYSFVYFDGLNRFYISGEHPELRKHFSHPPCVFDDFALAGTASHPFTRLLNADIRERDAQVGRLEGALSELSSRVAEEASNASRLLAEVHDLSERLEAENALVNRLQSDRDSIAKELEHHAREHTAKHLAAHHLTLRIEHLEAEKLRLAEAIARSATEMAALRATLENNATRFLVELQHDRESVQKAEAKADALAVQLVNSQRKGALLQKKQEAVYTELSLLRKSNHHWYTRAHVLETEYAGLLGSRSWAVTAPMRAARRLALRPVRAVALATMSALARHPAAWRRMAALLDRSPSLAGRLRALAITGAVSKVPAVAEVPASTAVIAAQPQPAMRVEIQQHALTGLSVRGTRIFDALRQTSGGTD